ncbi:hypothetical protein WJX84_010782, partial [Apatococcus fuscideae]
MDLADFGARFVTAVEDLSGVWPSVSQALDARLPLRNVPLRNKFGNTLTVDKLPVQYLLSDDPRLQRLRPYAHSPVTWFRNPFACLVLVSCEDAEDYRRQWRMQLKAILEREKDSVGGLAEWVICYVRPPNADALSKGPKKVMEALRHDFSSRRRERCVRLDLIAGGSKITVAGLDELERLLREAVKASFEARQAAYDDEVRKLMDRRQDKGWSFSTLFLVKDSLAIMLEAGGLLEDALREYSELEACYLEALAGGGPLAGGPFGGNTDGDDVAQLLKASWRETRRAVLHKGNIAEFHFRQYMFACQARLLLKLERPAEVVIRGLKFIQTFSEILSQRVLSARSLLPSSLPPARITLQSAASTLGHMSDTPAGDPPHTHHQRSMTEDMGEGGGGAGSAQLLARANSSQDPLKDTRSSPATMENGHARPAYPLPPSYPQFSAHPQDARNGAEAAGLLPQQLSLTPVRTGRSSHDSADANGVQEPGQTRRSGDVPGLDWDLGVSTKLEDSSVEEPSGSRWGVSTPEEKAAAVRRAAVCLLGHLYAGARLELLHLGHALGLSAHCEPVSPLSTPGRASSRQRSPFGHLPAPAYFQAAPQMLSKEAVLSSLASAPSGLMGPDRDSSKTELVGISSDGSQRAGGKPPAALTGALLHARSRSRFGPDFSAIHTATNVISRSHSRQSSMESISNAQIQSTTPADYEDADGDRSGAKGRESPMGLRNYSLPEPSQDG